MNITFIYIGKDKFNFVSEGVKLFEKRLKRYARFQLVEVADVKQAKGLPLNELKRKEEEKFKAKIPKNSYVVLLDENGKSFTSVGFAQFITSKQVAGVSHITFVVGGAYGFSDGMYALANSKVKLSSMTFSHQLIRVVFLEQLYRAFTIINNEPYHNQ